MGYKSGHHFEQCQHSMPSEFMILTFTVDHVITVHCSTVELLQKNKNIINHFIQGPTFC